MGRVHDALEIAERTQKSARPERTQKTARRVSRLGSFGFPISIVALIGVAVGWLALDERTRKLEDSLSLLSGEAGAIGRNTRAIAVLNAQPGFVDLSSPDVADLKQQGFSVVKLEAEEYLTGVRVSGRMINTLSVDHMSPTFLLSVDGKEEEFTISRISAGNSTGFSVYIPDVAKESARYGRFTWLRSTTILYRSK